MGFAALLPVIYISILWWFTTGIIIAVYRRSPGFKRLYFAIATVALILSLVGLYATRELSGVSDVYIAVTCGIVVWGWQLASYYLGFITGPSGSHQALGHVGWKRSLTERFRLALYFSIYHEVLSVATALLIAVLTIGGGNLWGLWMYVALWFMHASAKLNVFLGVRNFRIDILPREMQPLNNLLGKRRSNALFPFSIATSGTVVMGLLYIAFAPGVPIAQATGALMVATMMILGILEHWLLVLPLPLGFWGGNTQPDSESSQEDFKAHSGAYASRSAAPEVSE